MYTCHKMAIASEALSDRVAELRVRMKKCYQLKYIHVYLPTTSYPDEEAEMIYEEINSIIINAAKHTSIL